MGKSVARARALGLFVSMVVAALFVLVPGAIAQEAEPSNAAVEADTSPASSQEGVMRTELGTTEVRFTPDEQNLADLPANSGRTLVFGEDDNGFEGDTVASLLQQFGYPVERSNRLPADLSDYDVIWYVEAYRGLDASEIVALQNYVNEGGSLYVTGERPCCEVLNDTVEQLINGVLEEGRAVGVGGQGDIAGTFSFNPVARGGIVIQPNFLVDFVPLSPGAMTGWGFDTRAPEVFASSEVDVVGAVWTEGELRGSGRLVILMDIDWIGVAGAEEVIQNIQAFLTRESCSMDGHWSGFTWLGGTPYVTPVNCSTILEGSEVSWTALAEDGDGAVTVNGTDVTLDCEPPQTGHTPSQRCTVGLPFGTPSGTLRVTGTDPHGTSTLFYRVAQKNDPRNIPVPFGNQANWWEFPDGDRDGIPDKWENDGVWVDDDHLDLPSMGADPNRMDLFIYWDYQEGEALDDEVQTSIEETFANAPLPNPDGSTGVTVHLIQGVEIPENAAPTVSGRSADGYIATTNFSGFAGSPMAGSANVPQLVKYFYIQDDVPCYTNADGETKCPSGVAYIKGNYATVGVDDHWCRDNRFCEFMLREPSLNFTRAVVFVHELGHLLGLHHHGTTQEPEYDKSYKSVMSYSYSLTGIPHGFLNLHDRIDYARESTVNFDWKMGRNLGSLTFVLGQFGEDENFYGVGGNNELRFGDGEIPDEPDEAKNLDAAPIEVIDELDTIFDWQIPDSVLDPCRHFDEPPFSDIEKSFATESIGCIYNLGITTGTSPTTYSPYEYVTREQMAAFLKRLHQVFGFTSSCPTAATPFGDVGGSFAIKDIECIYGLGITVGTSPTTYSPGDFVTREQMAAFLVRLYTEALGVEPATAATPFTDIEESFAKKQIAQLYGLQVTFGTSPTTYSPGEFVTREQMAAFLKRMFLQIRP